MSLHTVLILRKIERFQSEGKWEEAGNLLGDVALSLEKGGADFIVICTNTMHKVVENIEKKIKHTNLTYC